MKQKLIIILFSVLFIGLISLSCSDDNPVISDNTKPVIGITQNSIGFSALFGGTDPAPDTIIVTNDGGGNLVTSVTSTPSWITTTVKDGGNIDTIIVNTIIANGVLGLQTDTITIIADSATNSPYSLPVILQLFNTIGTDPDSIIFTGVKGINNPVSRYLNIASVTSNTVDYLLMNNLSFVSSSKTNGFTPDSVLISIDTTSLSPGIYHDTIVVSSNDSASASAIVPVKIEYGSWSPDKAGNIALAHTLQHVAQRSNNELWIVGSVLNTSEHTGVTFTSDDNGFTWVLNYSRARSEFGDIKFANDTLGCIVGDTALIVLTTDGGQTWNEIHSLPFDSSALWSIEYITQDTAIAVGAKGIMIRSIDGGLNWNAMINPDIDSLSLAAIYSATEEYIWVVGNNGTILATLNGGDNWVEQVSPTSNDLWGVFFSDINNGWIVGSNGTLLQTTNGGITWISVNPQTSNLLYDVHFNDQMNGWIVGSNKTILSTIDGGVSWQNDLKPFQLTGNLKTFLDLYFIDDSTGLAVGQDGLLYRTVVGGN